MNPTRENPTPDEPTPDELLIHRIVNRCETMTDWDAMRALLGRDANASARVCDALQDDFLLRAATAPLLAGADAVELAPRTRRRARAWPGWLAAAALAFAWLVDRRGADPSTADPSAVPAAGSRAAVAPANATVVGELPRLLVRAEPTSDGAALRVLSLRRVLEESVVAQAFQVGEDERGATPPLPIALASFTAASDY